MKWKIVPDGSTDFVIETSIDEKAMLAAVGHYLEQRKDKFNPSTHVMCLTLVPDLGSITQKPKGDQ